MAVKTIARAIFRILPPVPIPRSEGLGILVLLEIYNGTFVQLGCFEARSMRRTSSRALPSMSFVEGRQHSSDKGLRLETAVYLGELAP